MFVFQSKHYGGAFKLLDSCCFFNILCDLFVSKAANSSKESGEHSRGGACIMDWLFYVSPLKKGIGLGICLSLLPPFITFVLSPVLLENRGVHGVGVL